jgi:hypothetical protein
MTNLSQIDNNVLAAFAAAGGAVFVKVVEKWASKRNDSFSEGERIRSELRDEIDKLKTEVALLKKEADEWRTKYWSSIERETTDEHRIVELEREVEYLRDVIKLHVVKKD